MTGLGFPQMEQILSPGRRGVAEVRHQPLSETTCALLAAAKGWRTWDAGGVNVALVVHEAGDEIAMMSDLRFERESCLELLARARGRVLIAGLGLGMILHPLCIKPDVERITVIEKLQDVIDLVGPSVASYPNVDIIHADIFNWKPSADARYDTIWFDIWPNWGARNLPQIAKLHQGFRKHLTAGGWMESWMRRESARQLRRQASPKLRKGRKRLAQWFHRCGIPVSAAASLSIGHIDEGGRQ